MIQFFWNEPLSTQNFQWIVDKLCLYVMLLRICIMYYIFVFVFQVQWCFISSFFYEAWQLEGGIRSKRQYLIRSYSLDPIPLFNRQAFNESSEALGGDSRVRKNLVVVAYLLWRLSFQLIKFVKEHFKLGGVYFEVKPLNVFFHTLRILRRMCLDNSLMLSFSKTFNLQLHQGVL